MNEFEVAARATKMYHLIRVLEPVLETAAEGGSVADLCARLDEEAWQLAANKAGVNLPSETTRLAVIESFRQRERVAGLSPVTGEQIAGTLTGENPAAPSASNGGNAADTAHPIEAGPAAHTSGTRRAATTPSAFAICSWLRPASVRMRCLSRGRGSCAARTWSSSSLGEETMGRFYQ